MFPWADSTLISTPTAMPYTRSIAFTLNGLRILNFSLSTSVRNASYINLGHNSHKFDINIVSPHPKLSSAFQSCEATVGISVDGKLLVDISPPGETFWGVDGLWTLKRRKCHGRKIARSR